MKAKPSRQGVGALLAGLALLATTVLPAGPVPARAQSAPDPRFGVIVTGATPSSPGAVQAALSALGASVWYSFGDPPDGVPGKTELVRSSTDLSTLAARAA